MRGRGRGQPGLPNLLPDLPLDAVEVVNNAGVFSCLYDAWAAMRNLEWMLPVTAGSDAHDVWYVGSAITRFPGQDAGALCGAIRAGQTQAQVAWAWSPDKLPRHLRLQFRSLLRFLALGYRRRRMRPLVEVVPPCDRRADGSPIGPRLATLAPCGGSAATRLERQDPGSARESGERG